MSAGAEAELKALEVALQMEEDGRQYYLEAGARCRNAVARATFNWLADLEFEHMKAIRQYDAELARSGTWGSVTPELPAAAEWVLQSQNLFRDALAEVDEHVPADATDSDALEHAMELELRTRDYYEQCLGGARDPMAQRFFGVLRDAEYQHYELLENTKLYLDNPDAFFQQNEGWLVEPPL